MKVTDVKTFAVDCFRTNWVFVKVYIDEGIDGVGEARAKALLKEFKTVSAVKNASVEELCKADSINEAVAENIYRYFHGENS